MTKLDEELERLLTRYEELVGRHYRGTLELRGQAEKYEADLRLAADLRDKLRTGQLVPAQPSGDEDAARYRWLRDHSVPPHNFYISVPDEFHGVKYGPDEVDAYIDAARAALGEKP